MFLKSDLPVQNSFKFIIDHKQKTSIPPYAPQGWIMGVSIYRKCRLPIIPQTKNFTNVSAYYIHIPTPVLYWLVGSN